MRSDVSSAAPTGHFENHLRYDVAGIVPTSHFENHLRSNVSGAIYLISEPELKTTERL